MRTLLITCLASLTFVIPTRGLAQTPPVSKAIEAEVFKVLDEFARAFNAKEPAALDRMFNFPHYRLVGDQLLTFDKPGQVTPDQRRVTLPKEFHHGAIVRREVIQGSPAKVHVAMTVSRFRADGSVIESFDTLWVLTNDHGHWGVKMRSTFAQLR